MNKFLNFGKSLWKDESGATAIEYGLLAALISVAIILAVTPWADAQRRVRRRSTPSWTADTGAAAADAGRRVGPIRPPQKRSL